jgi:hypothetical protein
MNFDNKDKYVRLGFPTLLSLALRHFLPSLLAFPVGFNQNKYGAKLIKIRLRREGDGWCCAIKADKLAAAFYHNNDKRRKHK